MPYANKRNRQSYAKEWYQDKRRSDPEGYAKRLANTAAWKKRDQDQRSRGVGLSVERRLLSSAKARAKDKCLPCTITLSDILVPAMCPVLGIELKVSRTSPSTSSPSLDRIVPHLGYVPGNVIVVSNLANMIKNNATPDQVILVGQFYQKLSTEALTSHPLSQQG